MTDFFDNILMFIIEKVVLPLFVIFVVVLLLSVPFLIYSWHQDSKRPEFSLKKDDWSCSKIYEYTTQSMIMVGKIMVPQTTTHKDCIQWSHK